jgi:hypothetical protein
MRTLLACVVVMIGLAMGGCWSTEPPYRVEDVAFDETLLGTWIRESPPPEEDSPRPVLKVGRRAISVKQGRLDRELPAPPLQGSRSAGPGIAQAYTIELGPTQAGEPPLKLSAYLVRSGGRMFVGVQLAPEYLGIANGYTAMAVHVLWLAERTEDRLTLRTPRNPVVWVRGLRSIDPPAKDSPDVPSIKELEGNGIPFTQDVDRLLRIYGTHAAEPSFWEEPTVFRRVHE